MQTNFSGLALVLAIGALGLAAYGLVQERRPPTAADIQERLDAIERRTAHVQETVAALAEERVREPALIGRGSGATSPGPIPDARPVEEIAVGLAGRKAGSAPSVDWSDAPEAISALIEEAVEKKAAQIQHMRDKKPSIDAFAETLELTDLQRRGVEDEVLRAQHEIHSILETPAADGTNFMDELVELLANGIAHPGQRKEAGMKLFGRLMTERVPGTDETYAARAEAVKHGLRESFRRNWNPKQYAAFEAWQMDPTEIKEIEGSPWKDIETRVVARAKELAGD